MLLLAGMLGLVACGKKGPPRAPIRLEPAAARDLRLRQIGGEVVILANLPGRLTDGTPLKPGASARVLRMPASDTFRPGSVSNRYLQRQFEKIATEVGRAAGDREGAPGPASAGGRMRITDAIVLEEARTGGARRYLYAVQVVDGQGRRSPLTAPRVIEVVTPPAAPEMLQAVTAEGEVRLEWTPVAAAEHYNVYRVAGGEPGIPELPLNRLPLTEPRYVDTAFQYGETYAYFARVLTTLEPPARESASSASVIVRPLDVFPPGPPGGLAAAAEGQVIRLYWFPSPEADLGGYRIYRRADRAAEFDLLGSVGHAETAFTDSGVGPGVRYHYRVTAVDTATPPNESPPSEERSEMLPQDAPRESPTTLPGGRP